MRGVRRLTFVKQQLLFADLAAALELVDATGARSLLFGGVPSALLHHADASLRPTSAAELFADVGAVPAIVAALERAGWRSDPRPALDLHPVGSARCGCTPPATGPTSSSPGGSRPGSPLATASAPRRGRRPATRTCGKARVPCRSKVATPRPLLTTTCCST